MDATQGRRYDLRFQQRAGCLRAEVQGGATSLELATDYWREVAAECHRRKAKRLLVVENLVGRSPDREDLMPLLIERFRALELRGVRIAFVKHDTQDLALAEFGGLLARDLGWTVQVFADEARAQLWLRHGATA